MGEDLFKLESVVLCDDIRREDNGKAILIGVYSGDIVVQSSPGKLALSLWLQGRALKSARSMAIEFKFSGEEDTSSETSMPAGSFNVEPNNDFVIAIGKIPVHFAGGGQLAVRMKFGDHDYLEIMRKKINVSAPTASIEPKQPS